MLEELKSLNPDSAGCVGAASNIGASILGGGGGGDDDSAMYIYILDIKYLYHA
jgi:hypothetical protein